MKNNLATAIRNVNELHHSHHGHMAPRIHGDFQIQIGSGEQKPESSAAQPNLHRALCERLQPAVCNPHQHWVLFV